MTWFKNQREVELERTVAHYIQQGALADELRRIAEDRAARQADLRNGLLKIHQPHAQAGDLGCQPLLYCTECANVWPCRTIEFAYGFGEFAPPAELPESPVDLSGADT